MDPEEQGVSPENVEFPGVSAWRGGDESALPVGHLPPVGTGFGVPSLRSLSRSPPRGGGEDAGGPRRGWFGGIHPTE